LVASGSIKKGRSKGLKPEKGENVMAQCLKIHCSSALADGDMLFEFIQKKAQQCGVEGLVQPVENLRIRIIVCGEKDDIEDFIEELHKGSPKIPELIDFEMEPFLKDRDYRGVFRIVK
jgi:acylphosphatase